MITAIQVIVLENIYSIILVNAMEKKAATTVLIAAMISRRWTLLWKLRKYFRASTGPDKDSVQT